MPQAALIIVYLYPVYYCDVMKKYIVATHGSYTPLSSVKTVLSVRECVEWYKEGVMAACMALTNPGANHSHYTFSTFKWLYHNSIHEKQLPVCYAVQGSESSH